MYARSSLGEDMLFERDIDLCLETTRSRSNRLTCQAPLPLLTSLASPEALRTAVLWGLAMRLADDRTMPTALAEWKIRYPGRQRQCRLPPWGRQFAED